MNEVSDTKTKQGQREGRQYPLRAVGMDDPQWEWCKGQSGGANEYIRKLIDDDKNKNAVLSGSTAPSRSE